MVLPIIAYGNPVLRKVGTEIPPDYPQLKTLIANMYDTMNAAYGVGLAAPQVGLSIRLFVVDASPFADDDELSEEEQTFLKGFKKTFINAKIVEETGDTWNFNEGCLSIPGVREDVSRHKQITIEYFDEDFNKQTSFKRQLIKSKLANISKGKVKVDYRMKFFDAKNKR